MFFAIKQIKANIVYYAFLLLIKTVLFDIIKIVWGI